MNDDLDAIRARYDAATPPPWTRFKQEVYDAQHRLLCYVNERHTSLDDEETRREDRNNAIFIAHSREDVAALLTLVDEQAATIARLHERVAYAETILARLADITAESPSGLFLQVADDGRWVDDWDAALTWIQKHLSMTPEASMLEQQQEVVNGWRDTYRDVCKERNRLRVALQDLYDDWPGPNTETLQRARAALVGAPDGTIDA